MIRKMLKNKGFIFTFIFASMLWSFFTEECFACQTSKNRNALAVMSFNIRLDAASDSMNNWKYRKDDVCRMIGYYAPDLLGMQEVCVNQMENLKLGLPGYTALGVGRDDGKQGGEFSPVFFKTSRFKLISHGDFALSECPEVFGVRGWDATYNRIATWAVLRDKASGRKLLCLNTHLDSDGRVARRESARLILRKIKEIAQGMEVIVTGDFNGTPYEEPVLIMEQGGMRNSVKASPVVYGPTWSYHDFCRIPVKERPLFDYVFVTPGIKVCRYRVIGDKPDDGFLSDHCPVIVDLTLK